MITDFRPFEGVIYSDAEEKLVKAVVLYGKTSDTALYRDAKMTDGNEVNAAELMELCKKGLVISYEGAFYTPVNFKDDSGTVKVVIATYSASAFAGVEFASEEKAEE